jgi:mono/diheme cytochrome c family protein
MRHAGGMAVAIMAALLVGGVPASESRAQGKGDPKAGEAVYKAQKCGTCHGETGAGDGPQGQKLKDKPSNWTADGGSLKSMDEQKIHDAIAKGGPAVGKSRAMPGYPKLSDADIWNLVAYVKNLMK